MYRSRHRFLRAIRCSTNCWRLLERLKSKKNKATINFFTKMPPEGGYAELVYIYIYIYTYIYTYIYVYTHT